MSDYSDETYDRYMLTGEGAEYFEETRTYEEIEAEIEQETVATSQKKLNEQLDDVIRLLKKEIKEKERIIKKQQKQSTRKKK